MVVRELSCKRAVGAEIRILHNLMRRDAQQDVQFPKRDELTCIQQQVMGYLSRNRDRALFQRDVEQEFRIRRSTASALITSLEQKGYLLRKSVDYDARLKQLVLTDRALALADVVEQYICQKEKRLTVGITPADLIAFFRVVDQLKKNLR